MRDTSQQPSSSAATSPEMPQREPRDADRENRLVRFGREHPALTVAGLAGAGLLGGIELAAGVLLGAGVAALIRRPDGARREHPAATRGPMRKLLERTPHDLHELKERARAVMFAARGEISAPRQAARDQPTEHPEAGGARDASM